MSVRVLASLLSLTLLALSAGCASPKSFSVTDDDYEFSTYAPPSPEQLEAIERFEREQAAIDDPAAF